MQKLQQLELFETVQQAYLDSGGQLKQNELYQYVEKSLGVDIAKFNEMVGSQKCNVFKRKIRWIQQSLKHKKLLVNCGKGVWKLDEEAKSELHTVEKSKAVIALSTELGLLICADNKTVLNNEYLDGEIQLCLTSPPYCLQSSLDYGGPTDEQRWVDFIMETISLLLPKLARGASIALVIGIDSFKPNRPARTTHVERLTLAMTDVGLELVDKYSWISNKAPGPIAWTSKRPVMLKNSYETILHFTNDADHLMSDNRRVRLSHTESHKKFVQMGGTKRAAKSASGKHNKRIGDYSRTDLSKGKIMTNAFYFANTCAENRKVHKYCDEMGLPRHPAVLPYKLCETLVQFLCPVGGLVIDPYYGSGAVAQACESTGRNWLAIEKIVEYVKGSFKRFSNHSGDLFINPAFLD
ncbi:hypothetical protein VroAM7_50300 (plasmid) [Vibrio rotiferianus]|uniref:Methyltransferase n=1 Tax=Vibrio rotiferianus TaxID=190895 RepID=A0A510IFQ5_9VIBR|nr:site-specific DNA-methyltransferase [Vibrio rotiferianus]BBL92377.1 hypothetical protein VroAM7_50300 [Vibrio rotiferianus]